MRRSLFFGALLLSVTSAHAQLLGTWSPLGDPQAGSAFSDVTALAVSPDGELYVAGRFSSIGGTEASNIARWDGMAWHALGTGLTSGYIDALSFGPTGDLYVVGTITAAGGVAAVNAARWDGAVWSAIGDGSRPGRLNEVYAGVVGPEGTLYVGGRDYDESRSGVYLWTGSAWETVGPGLTGNVWALTIGPDGALYAGGEFLSVIGAPRQDGAVMRWDGSAWTTVGIAADYGFGPPVSDIVFDASGALYAGGYFGSMDGVAAGNVARWDGTSWSALKGGVSVGESCSLAVDAENRLYTTSSQAGERFVLRWSGTEWARVGAATWQALSASVSVLARVGESLVVGGQFSDIGGVEARNLARFTPAAAAEAPVPESASVTALAPNPSRGASALMFAHAGGTFAVEIADALGRRVAGFSSEAPAGPQTVALPTAGLPPGVYVVRVSAGGTVEARTLTVVR